MDPSKKAFVGEKYKWAVQALALGASVQRTLFPELASVLDELEMDQQDAQVQFMKAWDESLLQSQREAVLALDGQLDAMAGEHNAELWEVDALANAPQWQEVRVLAREVLKRFGWALEKPPEERGAIYVTGPGSG